MTGRGQCSGVQCSGGRPQFGNGERWRNPTIAMRRNSCVDKHSSLIIIKFPRRADKLLFFPLIHNKEKEKSKCSNDLCLS